MATWNGKNNGSQNSTLHTSSTRMCTFVRFVSGNKKNVPINLFVIVAISCTFKILLDLVSYSHWQLSVDNKKTNVYVYTISIGHCHTRLTFCLQGTKQRPPPYSVCLFITNILFHWSYFDFNHIYCYHCIKKKILIGDLQ